MKVLLSYMSIYSLRMWLNFASILISTIFVFIASVSILSINTTFVWGLSVVMPLLVRLIVNSRVVGNAENTSSDEEHSAPYLFVNIQPIHFAERAFVSLIAEIFLNGRFTYGVAVLTGLWLLFGKFALPDLCLSLLLFLSVHIVLTAYESITLLLTISTRKLLKISGTLFNLLLNTVSVILFFSLFSFLGIPPAGALLVKVLEPFSVIDPLVDGFIVFILGLLSIVLILSSYLWRIFLLKKIYFIDFTSEKRKKKLGKRKMFRIGGRLFRGVLAKDISWLLQFPGLFVTFLYPLIFLVLASKLLFVEVEGFPVDSVKTLYLVTSIGYLSFFSDNQLSLNATFFAFDLNYPIKIRNYFFSKGVVSGVLLILIGIALFIINKAFNLGFVLDNKVLLSFLFYFFLVQAKGVIISILGYKPMVYNANQLRYSQFSFASSCLLSISNVLIMVPLYLLVIFPVPFSAIAGITLWSAFLYLGVIFCSHYLFSSHYYRVVEKSRLVEK